MADGPKPYVIVRGLVRSGEIAEFTDRQTGERRSMGTRVSILTEPDGGFLEVLVSNQVMSSEQAMQYVGKDVEFLISIAAWAGRTGNAGLQASFERELIPAKS